MLMTLDLATMLSLSAVLTGMAAALLLATWRAAGRPDWLAAWAGFCSLGALATLLYAQRGRVPEPLLTFGATPLYALGWALFWAGARRLRGAGLAWPWVLLPPLLWVLACAGLPPLRAHAELRAALRRDLVRRPAAARRAGGAAAARQSRAAPRCARARPADPAARPRPAGPRRARPGRPARSPSAASSSWPPP
ncbi:hypothetical protein [Dankookia sp. P2]|uniref:hypothetical protein n=1 Tax=Dankookia sp. P2 TaxID=3423955 RepID=UPI003D67E34A